MRLARRNQPSHRCEGCRLHHSVCICALIPLLETRTRVVLVMHQLELRKPTNTGRLAARCLTNHAMVLRGRDDAAVVDSTDPAPWHDRDRTPVLLFPHPDALPAERWRGWDKPVTLVVPDGTWSQCVRARRRIPGLADLPCATLPAGPPSIYRLRADPRPGYLCTLEAIARALGILEGADVQKQLEHILRLHIDRTLWMNGRIAPAAVTGGIPDGAKPHDPRSGLAKRILNDA